MGMLIKATHDPPTIRAFSKTQIAKSVALNSLDHELTLFPCAVGIVGVFAALLFGLSPVTYAMAAAGFAGSAVSWIVNYCFFFPRYANRYLVSLHLRMSEQRESDFGKVSKELSVLALDAGLTEAAGQGVEQFSEINAKFSALKVLLSRKFDEGETTSIRFAVMAEQVYLATLDNLNDAVDLMISWKAVGRDNPAILEARGHTNVLTDAQQKQLDAQRESAGIRIRQLGLVTNLLTANEEALTHLDHAIADVAESRIKEGEAAIPMEKAIRDLRELAERVRRYATPAIALTADG